MQPSKKGIRRWISLVLVLVMVLGLLPTTYAETVLKTENLTFGVLSDSHYFPTQYNGTRGEDYQNQISGDLRLMGEGEALTTGAVDQMLEEGNLPSVLLVTGDLSSEGELASHQGFAQQMARLQEAGVTVLVIPGNHDLYNSSAMTFESDTQIKDNGTGSLWTTEAQFREIYASMGYDEAATVSASNGVLTSVEYYVEDLGEDGIADCQGGLSYLAVTSQGYAFLMVDTEIYTADFNGNGQAWGSGKGMISDDLLAWILDQLAWCEEQGLTVISGMHHPLLVHNTTSETEFITDRVQVQSGENGYTTDANNTLVKTLADAGLRWVFTGHMHENDIASYTTASGNTLYDMETGGLVAYPAPYRMVTATRSHKADGLVEETLELSSTSVKEAAMNACLDAPNGEITNTEKVDVAEYMTNAMYGEQFPVKLIHRYVDRYLNQLADVPGALENIAGLDLYETLFNALPDILSGEMVVDLGGSVGELTISYSSQGTVDNWGEGDGVHLNPTSGAAGLLGSFTIRNSDIKTEVQSVLDQFESKYIVGGELNDRLDQLIVDAVDTVVSQETGHTLEDLLRSMFQRHNAGEDVLPLEAWQEEGLAVLADGALLQERVMEIIQGNPDDVYPEDVSIYAFINDVTNSLTIDLDTLFGRNVLWFNAVKAVFGSETPTVATLLDQFGVDIEEILNGLITEYLSDSFFTSVGGVVDNMISGFAVDEDGLDDVVDGEPAVLTYSGQPEAKPSVENGTLPYQITVSLDTANPETGRTFSWYTGTDITDGVVQLIPADGIANAQQAQVALDNGEGVESITAESQLTQKAKVKLNLILIITYEIVDAQRHTATVTLDEGQDYWYRVGSSNQYGELWSEPVLLQGDGDESGFTFINVADSQGSTQSDYQHYNNTLSTALDTFTDAAFITHLGDMVDDGINENYWTWVLDTQEMQSLPVIPVAGNHEARSEKGDLPNAIRAHYDLNIPEQDDSTGLCYSYEYENATFIVLNTNDGDGSVSQTQMEWAASVAENATTDWLILLTHKAPYSKGPHGDESDVLALRDALDEFCAEYDVDLVLSGHDHTYLRTPCLSHGEEVDNSSNTTTIEKDGVTYQQTTNADGTVFVIPSTTGVKYYELDSSVNFGFESEKEGQPYQPVYSGIEVKGDTLYYTAYTEDGQVYDSFSLVKSDEVVKTPAQQVMDLIDALPQVITLEHRSQVEAVRAAYEALEAEDKAQVNNLAVLEAAEEMISLLSTGDQGRTVTVNNGDELRNALNDTGVSKIILNGTCTFGGYETNWIGQQINTKDDNWAYTINHDVTIVGQGNVWERCILTITDGATVVLQDVDFKSQEGGKKADITPINLIHIQNGTLITQGSTSIRQTLTNDASFKSVSSGQTADSGHAIVIPQGSTGKVILNGTGLVHGSREAVYTGNSTDTIVIAGSTVNTDQDNIQAVYSKGDITITSGNVQSVHNVGTLTVTGGTIHNAQTQASAINAEGDVYLSGGAVQSDANVCLWTEWTGDEGWDEKPAIYVGGTAQLIGQNGVTVSALNLFSDNNLDLSVDTQGLHVAQAHADQAGIYALKTAPATLQELAANTQGFIQPQLELNTDDNSGRGYTLVNNVMSGQLVEEGMQQVYAKLRVVYGGKLTDQAATGNIVGGGAWCNLWLLSDVKQMNNVPVTQVQIQGEAPAMEVGTTMTLKGSTFPYTALNNQLTWSSSADEIATVDNGVVTAHQAGVITITATAPSGASDSVEILCVDLSVAGDTVMGETEQQKEYQLSTGVDYLPEGFAVKWSVEGSGAYMVGDTLYRNGEEETTVVVTGTLYYNDISTGLSAQQTVTLEKYKEALMYTLTVELDGETYHMGDTVTADIVVTSNVDEADFSAFDLELEVPQGLELNTLTTDLTGIVSQNGPKLGFAIYGELPVEMEEGGVVVATATFTVTGDFDGDEAQVEVGLANAEVTEDGQIFPAPCQTVADIATLLRTYTVTFQAGEHVTMEETAVEVEAGKTFGEVAKPAYTVDEHYAFAGWYAGEMLLTDEYEVDSDLVITAQATAQQFDFTCNQGDFTVNMLEGVQDGQATYGQDVVFTITPDADHVITSVTYTVGEGQPQILTAEDGKYTIPGDQITAEIQVEVVATEYYRVTFQPGMGVSMDSAVAYVKAGDTALYIDESFTNRFELPEPVAEDGYRLAQDTAQEPLWSDGVNGYQSSALGVSVTYSQDTTLTAQAIKVWTVTFSAGDHGQLNESVELTVDAGTVLGAEQLPTVTVQPGYVFVGWSPAVDQPIQADTQFVAQYDHATYDLILPQVDNVTFEVTGAQEVDGAYQVTHGTDVTITMQVAKGVKVTNLSYRVGEAETQVASSAAGLGETQFTIAGDDIVDAVSVMIVSNKTYQVTVTVEGGYGTVNGGTTAAVTFDEGTDGETVAQAFQFQADTGYELEQTPDFAQVTGDQNYTVKFVPATYKVEGVDGVDSATFGQDLTFKPQVDGELVLGARYRVGEGEWITLERNEDGSYTIPGAAIIGDVTIELDTVNGTWELIPGEEYLAAPIGTQIAVLKAAKLEEGTYALNGYSDMFYSEKYQGYVYFVDASETTDTLTGKLAVSKNQVTEIDYSGDVNGDGKISSADATAVNAVLHGLGLADQLTDEMRFALDVNKDGLISTMDMKLILDRTVGLV